MADADEAAELKRLVAMLDEVPNDSKADTLVAQLQDLEVHDPAAKVLLFTEFRETQEYLRRRHRGYRLGRPSLPRPDEA